MREAGVANMTDRYFVFVNDGQSEHAGHALERYVGAGVLVYFVIRGGDGLGDLLF